MAKDEATISMDVESGVQMMTMMKGAAGIKQISQGGSTTTLIKEDDGAGAGKERIVTRNEGNHETPDLLQKMAIDSGGRTDLDQLS